MVSIVVAVGVVAGVVAAVAGVGAWIKTRDASRAAAAQTEIERRRFHADMTPKFEVSCATEGDGAKLVVGLEGPPGLDRLDEIVVSIRDDGLDRTPRIAGRPSAEEIALQIWAPYRFIPGVDGADKHGRALAPFLLRRGDRRPFFLERTTAPVWAEDPYWWKQYADHPVRLRLDCYREGHDRWTVPLEVNVGSGGSPRVRFMFS